MGAVAAGAVSAAVVLAAVLAVVVLTAAAVVSTAAAMVSTAAAEAQCQHGFWVSHCFPPFLAAVTLYSVIDLELIWPTPLRS